MDSATQLIAGVWAGESCDELAVMRCLENACRNKVEWCGQHGITIAEEQWPSHGLPQEVITDKGRETMSRLQRRLDHYLELVNARPKEEQEELVRGLRGIENMLDYLFEQTKGDQSPC